MDKHLQIEQTKAGYQVQAIYLAARKVFDVGRAQPTYEAAVKAGAANAVKLGCPLLAQGYTIEGSDSPEIAKAIRCEWLWGGAA